MDASLNDLAAGEPTVPAKDKDIKLTLTTVEYRRRLLLEDVLRECADILNEPEIVMIPQKLKEMVSDILAFTSIKTFVRDEVADWGIKATIKSVAGTLVACKNKAIKESVSNPNSPELVANDSTVASLWMEDTDEYGNVCKLSVLVKLVGEDGKTLSDSYKTAFDTVKSLESQLEAMIALRESAENQLVKLGEENNKLKEHIKNLSISRSGE